MKHKNDNHSMGIARAIMCVIFPPFAVADRGCGTMALVMVLTVVFWPVGIITALLINLKTPPRQNKYVIVPGHAAPFDDTEYIRLADGTMAEVIEEGDIPDDSIDSLNHNDAQ